MDQHEAAAPDIAGDRQRHRQREADRDGGVHRVAAPFEDVETDARGRRLLADHHAVGGDHRPRGGEIGEDGGELRASGRGDSKSEHRAESECGAQGLDGLPVQFDNPFAALIAACCMKRSRASGTAIVPVALCPRNDSAIRAVLKGGRDARAPKMDRHRTSLLNVNARSLVRERPAIDRPQIAA